MNSGNELNAAWAASFFFFFFIRHDPPGIIYAFFARSNVNLSPDYEGAARSLSFLSLKELRIPRRPELKTPLHCGG